MRGGVDQDGYRYRCRVVGVVDIRGIREPGI